MIFDNLIFPYDYIILFIFAFIIIICFWKGFIQSILSLLTWIGSILITIYTYESLSNYITKLILNIEFFQNYDYLTNIASYIASIPIIFLISLFILKKIRKFLITDLDKQILGIFFDKFFGIIYGIVFTYAILTTMLILLNKSELNNLNNLNNWLNNNSYIIYQIDSFNKNYIYLNNPLENI